MEKRRGTVLYFDYGGFYSKEGDELRWNQKEPFLYSIVVEELTYSLLCNKICERMTLNGDTTKLKISYYPLNAIKKRPVSIARDDDVYCYVMGGGDNGNILNVEQESQSSLQPVREDRGSGFNFNNEGMGSNRVPNEARDPINTVGEQTEQVALLDNVPYFSQDNGPCNSQAKNDACEDVEYEEDSGIRNDDYGTCDAHEKEVVSMEWEDGLDIRVGQEFESKNAFKDLVERVVHLNCFEVRIVKSRPDLYVLKCRASSCTWMVRVAKLMNSDCFTVRTYKKMHTCSRITTSTRKDKQNGTPRLVANVLHDDYPGMFDTPSPKNLINLVQGRFGVKVSYSTALRGKNKLLLMCGVVRRRVL